MEWISTLINGLLLGGLYALFGLGLALVFGVMRVVNLAHGEFIVLGAYAGFFLVGWFSQVPVWAMLVPVVAATALATHAVIGEKQAKALEPLLATPISTIELLLAKSLTPFVFALALTWLAGALYVTGILLVGEPGVWRSILSARTVIMFLLLAPLVELATLQGDTLQTRLDYADGQVTLNGQTRPLEEFLAMLGLLAGGGVAIE